MKNRYIQYRTAIPALLMALALTGLPCLTAQADGTAIVGLWHVTYFIGKEEAFESYDQWHSDGQEFEVAGMGAGTVCQGTWTQSGGSSVSLYHVGWNLNIPGDGSLTGRFVEAQHNTVSADGNSYNGTWHVVNYDLKGHFISQVSGTLQATRLPPQ